MNTVDAAGRPIAVVDSGEGPVVLLVHGFPLNHEMWDAQIRALSPYYHVIAPDLCGFGSSRPAGDDVEMDLFADVLVNVLDELQVTEPVVYCGLSMGGYIGWSLWRHHQARVRAMILCDTRAAADTPNAASQRLDTARLILDEGLEPLAEALVPRLLGPTTVALRQDVVESLRGMMLCSSREGAAAALRGMATRAEAESLLPSIDVPSLLIVGRDDALSPPEEMQHMCNAIPDARLCVVEGAGHMAPMEEPEAVNQAMIAFLRERLA